MTDPVRRTSMPEEFDAPARRGSPAGGRVRTEHDLDRLPATGAWRAGDPPGGRRFAHLGPLDLDDGNVLPDVVVAYETWGRPDAGASNAVLVLHALTGDSHVAGPAGPGHPSPGWWENLVGPGKALDTETWFVVAANVLGGCQGSTGPSSLAADGQPWGSRFPWVTVRDQVRAEVALSDHLGIDRWALVIGGSMGGHRALEWAAGHPSRVGALAAIATSAATTADQIAWAHPQDLAIRLDPNYRGGDYYDAPIGQGPARGLALARQIAHITYRNADELDDRFGRMPQHAEEPLEGGRYAVESYLDHHGAKLAARFDANSYRVLTRAFMTHDVGRDRGGVRTALSGVRCPALVLAVDSDRLFLAPDSVAIAQALPGASRLTQVYSPNGHDGFLIEHEQVGAHLQRFLRSLPRD